jgi:hypothetical protein
MTSTIAEPTVKTAPAKPARQSRASRSAAQNKTTASKPATTPKPKADPKPEHAVPTAIQQKQTTAQWALDVLARELAKRGPKDVDPAEAAQWLGSWLSYLPGARQGRVEFPEIFGPVSMAGIAKKDD